ncbi:hypothetical protein FRC17_003624 [Serendipita sp. 399]|nr:hypothetical protein FRC17_003624 [Serendipita sp. 399]
MKIFALGASKNIGYLASQHMLAAGHTVVFLLRSTAVFDQDETMQAYIKAGKVILVKGDGLVKSDVENAWRKADEGSPVDLVLFTVGGALKFKMSRGFFIDTPNLTTKCLSNLLQAIVANRPSGQQMPRLIAISSTGITKESHDMLPFAMKMMYTYMLPSPHADKLGLERLLQHAMGLPWKEKIEPKEEVLPSDWEKDYPAPGFLPEVVVVRPAFLTDGPETGKFKVTETETPFYTISRRDVAHFIGERLLAEFDTWSGKIVNVGY